MAKSSECDVLIVGAGPAGLMTALWMSRLDIKTRIIDKRGSKVFNGQADGLQPRLMEMFESFGMFHDVVKEAYPMWDFSSWSPSDSADTPGIERQSKERAGYVNFGSHVLYSLNQGRVEEHLLKGISATSPITVERGVVPTSIHIDASKTDSDTDHPITLTLQHLTPEESMPFQSRAHGKNGEVADGLFRSNLTADTTPALLDSISGRTETQETVRAKYVVGTEGAHSWLRTQMGFKMEGESTDYIWGVIDCIPLTNFPDIRTVCMIQSAQGSMLVIPREKKLVRLYVQMAEVNAQEGREARAAVNPATILAQGQKILQPYTLDYRYCEWWTAYQIGQRVSDGFQYPTSSPRVFLAGDAVHTHSPKGGQGMNVSMHDAYNLGWKLGGVVNGWADRGVLRTYEAERRRIAQQLIEMDHKIANIFSGDPSPEELSAVYTPHMKFMIGYGVKYAPSILTAVAGAEVDDRGQTPITTAADVAKAESKHATGVYLGELMTSGPVLTHSESRPVDLKALMTSDGRWRVLVFTGDIVDDSAFARLNSIGEGLAPLVERYTVMRPSLHISNDAHPESMPEMMAQSLVDVLAIHHSYNEPGELAIKGRDITDFHRTFLPWDEYTGYDYGKVAEDTDMTVYEGTPGTPALRGAGKLYQDLGIDTAVGAMVVVRPDQYVGWVGALEDVKGVETFFAGVLKQQGVERAEGDEGVRPNL